MKVIFLGTGTSQGVPLIGCECEVCQSIDFRDQRLRSSLFIENNGKHYVIDSGPDFRQQMLRERIKKLDAIIYTHEHKDHVAGLDDVRAYNYLHQKPMEVYGAPRVLNQLKLDFAYAFTDNKYPGVPEINLNEISITPFDVFGTEFIPVEVLHYKLPVFGFRIGDFTYITDANHITPEEEKKISGSKVIVLNGLQKEFHISHYTFDEAVQKLKEWKPERAYLTHISHRLGKHATVEKELPAWIRLAYDGLQLQF